MSEKPTLSGKLRAHFNRFSARHTYKAIGGIWALNTAHTGYAAITGYTLMGAAATPAAIMIGLPVCSLWLGYSIWKDRDLNKEAHVVVDPKTLKTRMEWHLKDDDETQRKKTLEIYKRVYPEYSSRFKATNNQAYHLGRSSRKADALEEKLAAETDPKVQAKLKKKIEKHLQYRRNVLASKNIKKVPRP